MGFTILTFGSNTGGFFDDIASLAKLKWNFTAILKMAK